jgi:hypothetical protein
MVLPFRILFAGEVIPVLESLLAARCLAWRIPLERGLLDLGPRWSKRGETWWLRWLSVLLVLWPSSPPTASLYRHR